MSDDTTADPQEAVIAAIKVAFDGDPQAFISQTDNPNTDDVLMIGTVIQTYCYADFNGRRIVDVLRHAGTGRPRSASRLQDSQVFPLLERLVREHLQKGTLRDGLLKASTTVEMHRLHRHNFAHWIVRRVKGANALVMLSVNAREAERRGAETLDPKEASYCILSLTGFDNEVTKLREHTNYLARTAADLERNVSALRNAIASARPSAAKRPSGTTTKRGEG